jgi:hypothetical protein
MGSFRFPSAVSRNRLQLPQKFSVMEVMKPTCRTNDYWLMDYLCLFWQEHISIFWCNKDYYYWYRGAKKKGFFGLAQKPSKNSKHLDL